MWRRSPDLGSDDEAVRLRRGRAIRSLEGLSIGDAFGERFFVGDALATAQIAARELPPAPWRWTDDTAMAIPIVERLVRDGRIQSDDLALDFARRYAAEPMRGYGRGAHKVLAAIGAGTHWTRASRVAFPEGSRGNGSAMRSAPIGAYFGDDLERVAVEARASSLPTHGHPDAVAGAIAIAVSAALVAQLDREHPKPGFLIETTLPHVPDGVVRRGLERALEIRDASPRHAAETLGSGQLVLAEDTVPFAIWCADRHPRDFEEALWATVEGLGDRDTTCAMVGGIVGSGPAVLPEAWISRREALPRANDLAAGYESARVV